MTTLMEFLRQPLVYVLGWTLLHFLWQGTLVAILLGAVLGLLRSASPQWRYAAACVALLLVVVLPVITWRHLAATPPAIGTVLTGASGLAFQGSLPAAAEPWIERAMQSLQRSLPWIVSVWLAGVILLCGRLSFGLIVARRVKSLAVGAAPSELRSAFDALKNRLRVERAVKLASSALVQVPTVIGWLRPVVLIPVGCLIGLSASQVEALLAHELAHIRRHDYAVNVFQSMVETLLFYHPAVWWISKRIRTEREHCCDDLAIGVSGDALSYAKALSFLAEQRSSIPMVALGASGGSLAARIGRLLRPNVPPAPSRLAATTLVAALFVALALGIGAMDRAQSNASDRPLAVVTKDAANLPEKYRNWVDQVRWIINPKERAEFIKLSSDEERDRFIQQFWERRNPTPGFGENEFKKQYEWRVAYADKHFAAKSLPGSQTDRGRILILYGPPDEIDSHQNSGTSNVPTEFWLYYSIKQFVPPEHSSAQGKSDDQGHWLDKKNEGMTFVDSCRCGDYRLQATAKN